MILLSGIPSESPLAFLAEALDERGAEYRIFNQRRSVDCAIELDVGPEGVEGALRMSGETFNLREFAGIYLRFMDDRLLPELDGEPDDSPLRRRTRALHDALYRWFEIAEGRVVNRSDPQGSNGSKPYQAQLIARYGLRVPETLITSDPEAVLAFRETHGAIIYKSISGVRSIVKQFDDDDVARLNDIRWCPVQFQALVRGTDVRVHVIDQDVHATEIISDATDYRYARRSGGSTVLRATKLRDDLAEQCVALTEGLGLSFAGIDLRLGPDGEATCFEVNPSPGYSYYQANTGQPIAASLARFLDEG
jgi:glutathione synthase/RimK-type ligase-like ATP-grasp enzyme